MFYPIITRYNLILPIFQISSIITNSFLIYVLGIFFINNLTIICSLLLIIINLYLIINSLKNLRFYLLIFYGQNITKYFFFFLVLLLIIVFQKFSEPAHCVQGEEVPLLNLNFLESESQKKIIKLDQERFMTIGHYNNLKLLKNLALIFKKSGFTYELNRFSDSLQIKFRDPSMASGFTAYPNYVQLTDRASEESLFFEEMNIRHLLFYKCLIDNHINDVGDCDTSFPSFKYTDSPNLQIIFTNNNNLNNIFQQTLSIYGDFHELWQSINWDADTCENNDIIYTYLEKKNTPWINLTRNEVALNINIIQYYKSFGLLKFLNNELKDIYTLPANINLHSIFSYECDNPSLDFINSQIIIQKKYILTKKIPYTIFILQSIGLPQPICVKIIANIYFT
jgi:hypothetical protein